MTIFTETQLNTEMIQLMYCQFTAMWFTFMAVSAAASTE